MLHMVCRALMPQDGTYTRRQVDFDQWCKIVLQNKRKMKCYIPFPSMIDFLSSELRIPLEPETGECVVYNNGDLIMEVWPVSSAAYRRCTKKDLLFQMIIYQGKDVRSLAVTMAQDW